MARLRVKGWQAGLAPWGERGEVSMEGLPGGLVYLQASLASSLVSSVDVAIATSKISDSMPRTPEGSLPLGCDDVHSDSKVHERERH